MLGPVRRWATIASIAILLVSCAKGVGDTVTECVVNADQTRLFKGHWTARPIPLAVVVNDFSSSEISALQSAIDTWNSHFESAKGFELYMAGSSTLAQVGNGGTRLTSASACSQTVIGPNGFTNKIMIYKNATTWTYGSAVIALTSICPVATSNSTYRMYTSAVMEVNFVDYFRSGKPVPDLESVIVHELGHMLGLDHSCNGSACTNAPDEYKEAVMYPALGFNGMNGVQKRSLNTNDQGRANCLY
ncbi:MAG: matrixin family metalloprotease [Bdellovibrionales bacterium]|nr:matrixin family metalloprotease [Bdellovibrionales bacterium]